MIQNDWTHSQQVQKQQNTQYYSLLDLKLGKTEHRVYGEGLKIAHAINSQSLSHLLLINNNPSSCRSITLTSFKWYTFSLMSERSSLLCRPAC